MAWISNYTPHELWKIIIHTKITCFWCTFLYITSVVSVRYPVNGYKLNSFHGYFHEEILCDAHEYTYVISILFGTKLIEVVPLMCVILKLG